MVQAPRGSHPGQVGSLGSREGSVPFQGTGPLGAPITVEGRREEAWLELPWGGPGGLTGAQGRAAAGSVFTEAHRQSFFALTLGLGEGMSRDSRRKG